MTPTAGIREGGEEERVNEEEEKTGRWRERVRKGSREVKGRLRCYENVRRGNTQLYDNLVRSHRIHLTMVNVSITTLQINENALCLVS